MKDQGKPSVFKPHAPLNMVPVYKTLQELKASSPSRAHGLSEEDEERWKRAAINLIVTAGTKINMMHFATCTAIELFHRFYAEYSMVTNDRFLMAMACTYLGAKLADYPKSSRDIVYGFVETMCTPSESNSLRSNSEWMKQTRQAINDAERALLYQIGFRFTWSDVLKYHTTILSDEKSEGIGKYLDEYFKKSIPDDSERTKEWETLGGLTRQLAVRSMKVSLVLQYPNDAIAAACIWLGLKLLKIPRDFAFRDPKTGESKQWYYAYGLENKDLEIITEQITEAMVDDAKEAEKIINSAVKVEAEFNVQYQQHKRRGN